MYINPGSAFVVLRGWKMARNKGRDDRPQTVNVAESWEGGVYHEATESRFNTTSLAPNLCCGQQLVPAPKQHAYSSLTLDFGGG